MAEKKAKTAEKGGAALQKRTCPSCNADVKVYKYAGWGPTGLFWVCEKNCGYAERTH